jgi:hypothetical protein
MLGASVAFFFLFRHLGSSLAPPQGPAPAARGGSYSGASETLLHVLLALGVVLVVARLLGGIFKYFNQPRVIGEVIAGIILGPSLLGRVAPQASQFLLPANIAPFLGMISQIGGAGDTLNRVHEMVEEERTKAAGRARIAKDSIDMTGVDVKEAELTALADQALADFAAREGMSLPGAAADQPAARTMGAAKDPSETQSS